MLPYSFVVPKHLIDTRLMMESWTDFDRVFDINTLNNCVSLAVSTIVFLEVDTVRFSLLKHRSA